MTQPSVQLASVNEDKSSRQHKQQEIKISGISQPHSKPCPDLLNGPRKDYITIAIPLYGASIKGDWTAAKEILDKKPELVRYSITEGCETALHIAAASKGTKQLEEFVENLMDYMGKTDLELKNSTSNTALCLAAAAGNVKIVKILVKKNGALVAITGNLEMPPLYIAALFGHYDVVKYLYEKSHKLRDDCWTPRNRDWVLMKCVESDMFDIALRIVEENPELECSGSVLRALARNTDAFAETESNIIMRTINWVIRPKMQALKKESKANALELLTTTWQNIAEKPRDQIEDILRGPPDPPIKQKRDVKPSSQQQPNYQKRKYSSRIIFVAVERGNTRFIIELIRQYPDLIWKVNDKNRSIFHVAARHRQVDIYNLLHEVGSNKDLITTLMDENYNTMLHLVARSVERKKLEDVSGGAFQMQRELLWFNEVEEMIPRSYRERRNIDGRTARELFTKEHQDLVVKGEEWMKGTASQCMVVATLIATIVFAAAFTVPGGYSQNEGIPFFYQNTSFVIFVVADAISLFSSSAAILTFLSILTSGYAENDFLESLPRKLILGVATLYLSITTMMIAFSVSFFVLYSKDLKWIPILVTLIATMPVLLFAALQYRLLRDVIQSAYGSRYLFRPKKPALYYETSMSNRRWFRVP